MTNFEKVGLFMKTFGQEVKTMPSLSSEKINNLRKKATNCARSRSYISNIETTNNKINNSH